MGIILAIIFAFGVKLAFEGFSELAKHYSNKSQNNSAHTSNTGHTSNYDLNPQLANVYELGGKADKGDAEAQYNLGTCFYYGNGVDRNYNIAAKWYTKAANQGHAKAAYALGMMYVAGVGINQDGKKAIEFFYIASQKGLSEAKTALEQMKNEGREVDSIIEQYEHKAEKENDSPPVNDNRQAYQLFRKGWDYEQGNGVEANIALALDYYQKAADLGSEIALNRLNKLNEQGYSDLYKKNIGIQQHKDNKVNNDSQSHYIKAQNSKLLFDQAVELKRKGQYQASLMLYKQAYNIFPDDPDVQSTMYAMAKIYLLIGDYEKACALFQDGLTMKLAQNRERTGKFYQKYVMTKFTGGLSESDPEYIWFRNLTADYSIFIGLSHYLLENEGVELLSQYRYDFNNHMQSLAGKSAAMPSREYLQTCYEYGWVRVILIASEFKDSSLSGIYIDHVQERKQEFLDILKTIV